MSLMLEESIESSVAVAAPDLVDVPLEYVPINVGPRGLTLVAHDRNRLKQIIVYIDYRKRIYIYIYYHCVIYLFNNLLYFFCIFNNQRNFD